MGGPVVAGDAPEGRPGEGGGEIQGKVIIDPKKPDTVQVLLLKGRNPLTFQSKQILKVIPKVKE